MIDNPYSAPAVLEGMVQPSPTEPPLSSLARGVFLAWEKLRLVYIGILFVFTVFLVVAFGMVTRRTVFTVIEGAIAANLLYFAGPSIETYVRWLGYNHPWPRWFMFVTGTLLSMFLAVALLSSHLIPDQD